ncbi:MAG TPA: glycosyltransferase family 4 protein [Candidatus Binataceae bacterium]|jgi:glycosyltransferase involved in cell wall biosynthesis|nr:glycosyltransferase family 4 protein [Candidatus Binataceae bacterium]
MSPNNARIPLIYVLHSGQLYGTERMALATAAGVSDEFATTFFAPPGSALCEAQRMGFGAVPFAGVRDVAMKLMPYFARHRRLAFVATGVVHSLACVMWSALWRRQVAHLHVVHGGTDERDSYGRKRRLNRLGVVFVAVSRFVRERLIANGVRAASIKVIENFLPDAQVASTPRRAPFCRAGVRRLVVVSRLDPIKRVDLLLDAFDLQPVLGKLSVEVLGSGYDLDKLRARAAATHPQIRIEGFHPDVPARLAASDLLVHLCPAEPFGLAILEAMAAGVPALVPDRGGAGDLVEDGVNGFRFHANDSGALAARLIELSQAAPQVLNQVVAGGRYALATRFSAAARVADYRVLLHGAKP